MQSIRRDQTILLGYLELQHIKGTGDFMQIDVNLCNDKPRFLQRLIANLPVQRPVTTQRRTREEQRYIDLTNAPIAQQRAIIKHPQIVANLERSE